MKKRALLSVSDKTGIIDFASGLVNLGYEIVSTGGTFKVLQDALIPVINISDITGFPECLDGRVKTLHPMVHAGILAIRDNPDHMEQIKKLKVNLIDVVAINLYPFKETILKDNVSLEDAIENIDIGGPTMLRAAAKNFPDVAVIVEPSDYQKVLSALESGSLDVDGKFELALKVFTHTAAYDALIASYLRKRMNKEPYPQQLTLTYEKVQSMRYGENPHQSAAFYKEIGAPVQSLSNAVQLSGKELSFNNINDANGALDVLREFGDAVPCAVAVKHANPCGVGVGGNIQEAYSKAFDSDPVSIFGGIVAVNRIVDLAVAQKMGETFLEIIIAPDFTPEALALLSMKKNLRLLKLPDCANQLKNNIMSVKSVVGGLLVQELDTLEIEENDFKVVTKRAPTDEELTQLLIAMKVVKHVKSNGICLVADNATVGIGPGQTNRVTALDIAVRYAGGKAVGSVMGSDAFLPFSDCVELAHEAGVTAIVHPGGSVRDQESIDACDKYGIAMVFSNNRHFKH